MTDRPLKRKLRASPWWAWVILGGVLVTSSWLLLRWATRSPLEAVGYAAAGLVLGGIGVLSARFRRVGQIVDSAFTSYWRLMAWMFCVFGPLLLARLLSNVVAASPLVVAVGALAGWCALLLWGLHHLSTKARRQDLWRRMQQFGVAAPFVYALAIAGVAVVFFATLAFVLADRDLIRLGTGRPRATTQAVAEPADLLDFFTWHMLDAVPTLKVTETLRWDEPLGYDDSRVGWLLIGFKVIVISPTIAAFASFWRFHKEPPGPSG